jgi:hypothetical protein
MKWPLSLFAKNKCRNKMEFHMRTTQGVVEELQLQQPHRIIIEKHWHL